MIKQCYNCSNYTIASELLNAGICKICRYVVSGSGYCPEWEGKVLKDLIKKLENWKEAAKKNPYSGLKESVIYERVIRELRELQTNIDIKQRIEEESCNE